MEEAAVVDITRTPLIRAPFAVTDRQCQAQRRTRGAGGVLKDKEVSPPLWARIRSPVRESVLSAQLCPGYQCE